MTIPAGCIRFVSDLHLGHGDAFAKHPEELRFLLEGCSTLVVCGDMVEDRKSPFREESMRQKAVLEGMCQEAGVTLIPVCGNHDPNQEHDILRLMDGKVAALHGHCLFKEVAPWSWDFLLNKKACRDLISQFPEADTNLDSRMELARAMSLRVAPIIRHVGKGGQRSIIGKIGHIFWPPERPLAILRAWMTMDSRMFRFAKQFLPEARLICYGHFHRRHVSQRNGVTAVNLGAFVKHATSYAVDLEGDIASVREAPLAGFGKTVHTISLKPSGK